MDKFNDDIESIYKLANKEDTGEEFISLRTISKQYLAYYLYRIITKYFKIFQTTTDASEIARLINLLKIPDDYDPNYAYPLAGKMVNDDDILDLIIVLEIRMFRDTTDFLEANPTFKKTNSEYLRFLESKPLDTIVKDLIDLQKLLPGLSVSALRPNYLNNRNI
jgi:hypothetical protein